MPTTMLGGNWLRKPSNGTVVIFVHGILSSGETAWTHENGASWPSLLESEPELRTLGVCVFSYRSDWLAGAYSISDAVDSLREFVNFDELWDKGTLVFVCHSMGGIVARRFVLANQAKLIDRNCKIGLFLVASPSLGSADANRLYFLARMLGNTQAQALVFSQQNVWLNDLDRDFLNLKESGRIAISGKELVEDEPVLIKKLLGLRTQLVEPFSGARYFPAPVKVPHSTHSSIAKPESRASMQHRILKAFLRRPPYPYQPHLVQLWQEDTNRATHALSTLRDRLAAKSITQYEALAAIEEALLTTRSYLQRRAKGEERDGATEDALSEVWSAAGQAILPYDQELANLCWVKGHAWADEKVWSDPRYKDLPVGVNDMLEKVLEATKNATNSAKRVMTSTDIAEGFLSLDTVTWRTSVLLPAFADSPEVTLVPRDGRGITAPKLESVTPDKFTASINDAGQTGEWIWRARGRKIGQDLDIVEGRLRFDSWRTTVLLPPFSAVPIITLVREDGRSRQDPVLESVTPDLFTASINSSTETGVWVWRARGSLLR